MEAFVEAENLTRTYGAVRAVDRVSFQIRKGEVVGLLGPNGAGKTTTMKMLTCFMPPTEGRVRVAGLDVVEHSLEVRRRLGYLPENVPLYDEMGVWEYLDFMARVRGIEASERGRAIRRAVARCGLGAMIGKPVSALSKGYRQRLGLAQAVIHDPDLVILDEPTTGLDPNQIVEIRQLIRQIGSEKTVLLSTHILQEVEAVCDRVLIINDGRIIADGTPAQLHSEFQGAQELSLLIGGAAHDDLSAALGGIAGAERVQVGEPDARNSGVFAASVTSGKDTDLREAIFRLCVQRGWVLLEMHRRVVSLEDIFRKLTVREGA
ncbi:MAG: ATP-binding cassette domain-containing protein [Nitrospirota bacterium]|nr:ATP-binding cassette domain-containing protein [Nitrospirota bacterium]